jgi:GNAT superfamily N-acetyltransferase
VATLDDVVVGFATLRESRVGDIRVANVIRVFVTARARRIGVGDALIKGARNTASSRGCSRIDALALPGDRDTKNLFERNGLTARLIVASSPL